MSKPPVSLMEREEAQTDLSSRYARQKGNSNAMKNQEGDGLKYDK